MINTLERIRLPLIVFLSGAVVMILELVGSRLLAPYLGTSIFIWTSLIGVILASLSIGYSVGGKIADKKPSYTVLSLLLFLAALAIALTALDKSILLKALSRTFSDIRTAGLMSAILLFTPASVLLGMISPYAVKLKLQTLEASGSTVGNLYAISTIGSIVGTFLSGFVLLSLMGSTSILYLLSLVLVGTALLAWPGRWKSSLLFGFLCIIGIVVSGKMTTAMAEQGYRLFETPYKQVLVLDTTHSDGKEPVRIMVTDPTGAQSGMFLESDDLVYTYTKFYRLGAHFFPNMKQTLMIGGGGYSYPKEFIERFPNASMDVVEIDPMLTDLSKEFFRLKDNPRLKSIHEDGRTYLQRTDKTYDIIYGDAYNAHYTVPHHLTTKEFFEEASAHLSPNGVMLLNIISAIDGEEGKFLRAEYATLKEVFPHVYIFPVSNPKFGAVVQNVMVIAFKSQDLPNFTSSDSELAEYLTHRWEFPIPADLPILTDDFAPVEQYMIPTYL